ncbi:3-dehydroquinate synthase [bacterium]|jgi:3-dehydroquinate synthase|nr:3-dehydroquinate synthase [bacterium]
MLNVRVPGKSLECWVSFDREVLQDSLREYENVLVLVDQAVEAFGNEICEGLAIPFQRYVLEGGEHLKSFSSLESLLSKSVEVVNRKGAVLAIGGGALADFAGFLASILYRSIPCFLVPTTLLSMVDSAIGGKTAMNLPAGKNLVGSFSLPRGVYLDSAVLKSLPEIQWLSGMGEVLKTSAIDSVQLFKDSLAILSPDKGRVGDLDKLIGDCIEVKKRIVESDYREEGRRKLLNAGHTIGHALESFYRFDVPHGICVWMGLILESRMGERLGKVCPEFRAQLENSYSPVPIPLYSGSLEPLLPALLRDKKNSSGRISFVLIKEPGVPVDPKNFTLELEPQEVLKAFGEKL